jgi:enoyl-CoA hydratase/carnithine racemase
MEESMAYSQIEVEIGQDHIAEIVLNRPEHLNAFNTPMARELNTALNALDEDSQVRVILIKGAGKAFCAGIDLKEFPGKTAIEYHRWIETMERPFITISRMYTPVIAQVQGVAAANGCGLVAAADLAIASQNTKLGLTAIKVGLNCVGPVVAVARSLGRKRALELLLFGDLIKAPQALEMGLINRVVPKDQLASETRRWAQELASKSPIAAQMAKKAFYDIESLPYEKAFAHMNEVFARLCMTEDAQEGINAFFDKRPPVWQKK